MNAIALAVILMIRVLLPFCLLMMVGEWLRQREMGYWLRR